MGTLASELGPHVERTASQPRVYVDANMPARLVGLMRIVLKWDALFVVEHDALRRATDAEHFRLAREWRRTLITLDRDYLDDRKFPPDLSGGVLVLTAPGERGLGVLLTRIDQEIFRVSSSAGHAPPMPLEGQKLQLHIDWAGVPNTEDSASVATPVRHLPRR